MHVKEKLMLGFEGLEEYGPINIVIFGDSVSHGALGFDEMSYETVYWNRLRQMLNETRDYMPVNMIHAAIGGETASGSVKRLERDVLSHHPDLVIVCFGLNDVNGTVEAYTDALRTTFTACQKSGADVIFLTPNMLNTYVVETLAQYKQYAGVTAKYQNDGTMDALIEAGRQTARDCGVPICDAYAEWKKLQASGVDTTALLANSINHPKAEMHALFAELLYAQIMGGEKPDAAKIAESTMFRG